MLNKNSFIRATKTVKINIEELSGEVFVKRMSIAERTKFFEGMYTVEDGEAKIDYSNILDNQIKLLAMTLCDEKGKLLFDNTEEDLNILRNCEAGIIDKVYEEAAKENGLVKNDLKDELKN